MVVLGNYTKDIGAAAKILTAKYQGLYQKDLAGSLLPVDADKLFKANAKDNPEEFALRSAIMDYLNYMEYVCAAYENQTVDQATIEELYGGLFKRRYKFFREFIVVGRREVGEGAWAPIERVVGSWETKGYPALKKSKRTGW